MSSCFFTLRARFGLLEPGSMDKRAIDGAMMGVGCARGEEVGGGGLGAREASEADADAGDGASGRKALASGEEES